MCVDIVASLAVFDEAEGIVLLNFLNRATRRRMIILQCAMGKGPNAHKLLIGVVHLTLGEGDGGPRNEQADTVLIGNDFQIGGINNLHRIGKIGHQVGDVEAVLRNGLRNALDNVLRLHQRLIAVDHNIEVSLHLVRNLIQALRGRLAVRRGHNDLCAKALRHGTDLFVIRGDIDLLKALDLFGVLPDPVQHGLAADLRQRLHMEAGRTSPRRNHTDDFHCILLVKGYFLNFDFIFEYLSCPSTPLSKRFGVCIIRSSRTRAFNTAYSFRRFSSHHDEAK